MSEIEYYPNFALGMVQHSIPQQLFKQDYSLSSTCNFFLNFNDHHFSQFLANQEFEADYSGQENSDYYRQD